MNQISGKICVGDEVVATIDGHWVRNNVSLWFFLVFDFRVYFFSMKIVPFLLLRTCF